MLKKFFALALLLAWSQVNAGVIYDNGVVGNSANWDSDGNFAIADDFSLSDSYSVTGVTFAFGVQNINGADALFDFGIYDEDMTNLLSLYDVSVSNTSSLGLNLGSYNVYEGTIDGFSLDLAAGNYWFAFSGQGEQYIHWGVSQTGGNMRQSIDGLTFDNYFTRSYEQQFSILGTSSSSVPEPSILTLMGLSFATLGFARRRKLRDTHNLTT